MEKYLKSIADNSVIVCDEILNAADSASTNTTSTNVTNTLPTNVMSTVSRNLHNKKVNFKMDYYILHTVLLVITLLFTNTITCYRYAKHRAKLKKVLPCRTNNKKCRIMSLKKFLLKIFLLF